MQFDEMGQEGGKTLMLLPGTACDYQTNFGSVLDRLAGKYHLICVNYDGFDGSALIFPDMITVTQKIERYIRDHFDGRIDVIFGTHTHVQTADERIMPHGTGYITDLGMCGPDDSVLGIKKENIIEKLMMHLPVKFDFSDNHVTLHGAIFDYDLDKKRCVDVKRFEM